jgi:hypothetical protein
MVFNLIFMLHYYNYINYWNFYVLFYIADYGLYPVFELGVVLLLTPFPLDVTGLTYWTGLSFVYIGDLDDPRY